MQRRNRPRSCHRLKRSRVRQRRMNQSKRWATSKLLTLWCPCSDVTGFLVNPSVENSIDAEVDTVWSQFLLARNFLASGTVRKLSNDKLANMKKKWLKVGYRWLARRCFQSCVCLLAEPRCCWFGRVLTGVVELSRSVVVVTVVVIVVVDSRRVVVCCVSSSWCI